MSDWAKSVIEFLKIAPRYCVAILMLAGFLLFLPAPWIDKVGLGNFTNDHRVVIALIFFSCLAIVLWEVLKFIGRVCWALIMQWSIRKKAIRRLNCLTEDEKKILRFYVWNHTKSNMLRYDDGVVNGLESVGIIYRSSNLGNMLEGFPYNINEFVWQYLHKHQELLVGETSAQRTDKRCSIF